MPSKVARNEGWLAPIFVGLVVLAPLFPQLSMWLPEGIGLALGFTLWGCAWLFAISGVRHGKGGAYIAASWSLGILIVHAGLMLLIAFH